MAAGTHVSAVFPKCDIYRWIEWILNECPSTSGYQIGISYTQFRDHMHMSYTFVRYSYDMSILQEAKRLISLFISNTIMSHHTGGTSGRKPPYDFVYIVFCYSGNCLAHSKDTVNHETCFWSIYYNNRDSLQFGQYHLLHPGQMFVLLGHVHCQYCFVHTQKKTAINLDSLCKIITVYQVNIDRSENWCVTYWNSIEIFSFIDQEQWNVHRHIYCFLPYKFVMIKWAAYHTRQKYSERHEIEFWRCIPLDVTRIICTT